MKFKLLSCIQLLIILLIFYIAGEDEILLESGRGKDSRLVSFVGDSQGQTWKVRVEPKLNLKIKGLLDAPSKGWSLIWIFKRKFPI